MNGFLKYLFVGFAHFSALILLVFLFYFLNDEIKIIQNFDFLLWDATHYFGIVNSGYDFSSAAFFPGFPGTWAVLKFTPFGISAFNGIIFLIFSAIIAWRKNIQLITFLFYLSIPSLIFMFMPYAEAMTFLFAGLFLLSLESKSIVISSLFLFLVSFFKPTLAVLFPAILIAEFLFFRYDKLQIRRVLLFSSALVLGSVSVLLIQYSMLNDYFAFFKAQKAWGNFLQWPNFPLSTWNQSKVIWLDAFAFYFALICLVFLVRSVLWKKSESKYEERTIIYSTLFIVGSTGYVILFRDGMLFSLNRFVFATPFALLVISNWTKIVNGYSTKSLRLIFPILLASTLIFGSYMHIRSFLYYSIFSLLLIIIFSTWSLKSDRGQKGRITLQILTYLILFAAQIYYTIMFVRGGWLA